MGQGGRDVYEMLAVVEYQEHLPGPEALYERLEGRTVGSLARAQNRGHRSRHEVRVGDGGELYPPHPALKLPEHVPGHDQREAPLAAPPGAKKRQRATIKEQPLDLVNLPLSPDEAAQL